MILKKMTVSHNNRIAPAHFAMGLDCAMPCGDAKPGQFVMVQIPEAPDLVLRRPFSICRLVSEQGRVRGMEILYRVVGKGTAKLSQLKKGDPLDVLGPLGRGFDIPENTRSVFIVGGGIGVAPLIYLLFELMEKKLNPKSISIFSGARSRDEILCLAEMEKMAEKGVVLQVTTDDGSLGEKGVITGPLEKCLEERKPDMLYACGPLAMLKKVAHLAARSGIRCQISMEAMMACGMGACLGCAVRNAKHPDHYDHVCLDGPVFDLDRFGFETT
jgi:dihydroorotate dehydrogenase electron transfer subunit